MQTEPGGWRAAIDPSLAARLLRPAVRPGVSDPAHGPALAARLRRMAAPTLADDVARRYGGTAMDVDRPPVVYATPLIPAPSVDSRRGAADPSGTLRKGVDGGRPVVQARARTTGPVFPPLQAGPVQRMMDPAAWRAPEAAPQVQRVVDAGSAVRRMAGAGVMPVAAGRRMETGMAGDASTGPRGAEVSIPARPVVAPAPTRLQRQIAAEHAEAVPVAVLRGSTQTVGGGGTGGGASPAAARAGAGERAAGLDSAVTAAAVVGMGAVQRRLDPTAADPPRVAGRVTEAAGTGASPVVLAMQGDGAAGAASGHPAALPVAAAGGGGMGGAPVQALRALDAERWNPPGGMGGSGPVAARPVVPARSGGGTGGSAVQRMAVQRMAVSAGAGRGSPATRMVHAAPVAAVQRQTATTKPPPGGPGAELPTMRAGDAPGTPAGGGHDAGELAEQVYGILVRRLEDERKRRGW